MARPDKIGLVLSRKIGESVILKVHPSAEYREIIVRVADIRGNKVRIGFDADKSIAIGRDDMKCGVPK